MIDYQLTAPIDDPRRLTVTVLQIAQMLGLYQAELARILELRCADIGRLAVDRECLEPGSRAWAQAQSFCRMYQALYTQMDGDGVRMRHWLWRRHPVLDAQPLLLMVDRGGLARVVQCLEEFSSIQI